MSLSLRLLLLTGCASITSLSAQVSTPTTPVVRKGVSTPKEQKAPARATLSDRARQFNEDLSSADDGHTAWSRSVIRLIDRKTPANAPLFFPTVTTERQGNLFSLLFRLLADGKITAYSYQDSEVMWDEAPQLSFADLLERFQIPSSKDPQGKLQVALADIPSALVEGYYILEQSRFDEGTSSFSTTPLALCPLLTSVGDYGQVRMPLFWLRYTDVRPYLAEKKTALSATNTAQRGSFEDFFTLRLYRGEIVKTKGFGEQAPSSSPLDPTLQRQRQEHLEQELQRFEGNLYLPDSLLHPVLPAKASKKKSSSTTSPKVSAPKVRTRDRRVRASKPAQSTAPRSSTRSVRDRS